MQWCSLMSAHPMSEAGRMAPKRREPHKAGRMVPERREPHEAGRMAPERREPHEAGCMVPREDGSSLWEISSTQQCPPTHGSGRL